MLLIHGLNRVGRPQFVPLGVAAYIGAAVRFTSSGSFANPAATVGRAFTDPFTGISPGSLPGFVGAQLAGGALRTALAALLFGPFLRTAPREQGPATGRGPAPQPGSRPRAAPPPAPTCGGPARTRRDPVDILHVPAPRNVRCRTEGMGLGVGRTAQRVGRAAYAHTLRVASCALLAWQTWLAWRKATYGAATIDWSCDSRGCATNDLASVAPMFGSVSAALLALLCVRYLRGATGGVVVLLSALASIAGWHAALRDGRATYDTVPSTAPLPLPLPIPLSVSTWLVVLWVVAAAACAGAWWGGAVSLRRTAALRRLSRRYATAPARVVGWHGLRGRYGAATAVFHSADGVRHTVPVLTERHALLRPVTAVYDPERPDDPDRTRVWVARRKLLKAL